MSPIDPVWLGVLLALAAAAVAALSWWRGRDRTDLLYVAATLSWVVLALTAQGTASAAPEVANVATRLAYQLLAAGVTAFLLYGARHHAGWPRLLVWVQALAGSALALICARPGWTAVWFGVNAVFAVLLVGWLASHMRRGARPGEWMVLLMAICGVGVMLTDVHGAAGGPLKASALHFFYLPMLFALWRALRAGADSGPADGAGVAQERQRMAQEMHDGVGSHLTTLISALDMGTPRERITAGALRECLAELKLLVDGADEDASAMALLASLRYRMQPLLEAAGIALRWQVADEAELEQVSGAAARDMLRIAQEALANAVRHSGASEVALTLCRQRARHLIMLEVADNGRGVAPERRAADGGRAPCAGVGVGKGLAGMRQRAQRLGGELHIDAVPGGGTRITLLVPLQRLRQPARPSFA